MDHRKMRRERRKLFVRQPKIVRHESSPPYGLESRQITRFNGVQTLIHVAGFNLGLLMRALHGQGTPREAADARAAFILVWQIERLLVFGVIAVIDAKPAALVVTIALAPTET